EPRRVSSRSPGAPPFGSPGARTGSGSRALRTGWTWASHVLTTNGKVAPASPAALTRTSACGPAAPSSVGTPTVRLCAVGAGVASTGADGPPTVTTGVFPGTSSPVPRIWTLPGTRAPVASTEASGPDAGTSAEGWGTLRSPTPGASVRTGAPTAGGGGDGVSSTSEAS